MEVVLGRGDQCSLGYRSDCDNTPAASATVVKVFFPLASWRYLTVQTLCSGA